MPVGFLNDSLKKAGVYGEPTRGDQGLIPILKLSVTPETAAKLV